MGAPTVLDFDACAEIAESELQPYAGRERIGTIFRLGRSFLVFDLEERHKLTTNDIRAAMRSLTAGGAHAG